jgi:hypothetical protein
MDLSSAFLIALDAWLEDRLNDTANRWRTIIGMKMRLIEFFGSCSVRQKRRLLAFAIRSISSSTLFFGKAGENEIDLFSL